MKVLFIGDVVGAAGREAVRRMLPALKQKHQPDFVLVNAENAAGGKGLTEALARELYNWGADGLTMGNHTWDNKDIFQFIDDENRLVRPANFPPGTPGQGMMVLKNRGKSLAVINMQGRTFMPPLDCPFRTMDALLEELGNETRCVFVDFHAEATSEKIAMGWYLDGRASVVVGTHTHVQTHDEQVLPGGTAYVTDVGMCGSSAGILGMEKEAVMHRFLTGLPARFTSDTGPWQFHAVLTEIDETTGKATQIRLIRMREDEFIYE